MYNNEEAKLMDMVISSLKLQIDTAGNMGCPICDSSKKNKKRLHINIAKGVFRCAACATSGNAVHLYAWLRYGISPERLKLSDASDKAEKDKRTALMLKYKRELLSMSGVSNINTYNFTQNISATDSTVATQDLTMRDKVYECMLDRLTLNKEHYNNLIKRGLRRSDILQNGYKSVPEGFGSLDNIASELRSKDACSLSGVPGFLKKKEGNWTLKYNKSGFYIPVRAVSEDFFENPRGKIEGLQIRFDTLDNESDARYKWLSSGSYNEEKYTEGCRAYTWSHFVGYPEREAIITEGPLKSDIIYRFIEKPVLGIPGVNSIQNMIPMLDKLAEYGVSRYKIAFDMDMYKNPNVAKALTKLLDVMKEKKLECSIFKWDPKYKGLDDYLLNNYLKAGHNLDPTI